VEDVAPLTSGDQFAPDQSSFTPPFQKFSVTMIKATVLVSSKTAPLDAKALPLGIVAPSSIEMLVRARILPSNTELVPRVAEAPICQNMLESELAPSNVTTELEAELREAFSTSSGRRV
jgi:hypothetical protein